MGLATGLAGACVLDQGDECQRGTEGCPCTPQLECLAGLMCFSGYCVDPNWNADTGEVAEGGSGDGGGPGDDGAQDGTGDAGPPDGTDGEGGSAGDNVGACEEWIEAFECGDYDWGSALDCDIYVDLPCDISDYFNCLTENTACVDGIPDTSGWANCASLATCV